MAAELSRFSEVSDWAGSGIVGATVMVEGTIWKVVE